MISSVKGGDGGPRTNRQFRAPVNTPTRSTTLISAPIMRPPMLSNSSGISAAIVLRHEYHCLHTIEHRLFACYLASGPSRFGTPDGQAQLDVNSAPKRRRSPIEEESTSASWAAAAGNQQLDCVGLFEQ